MKKIFLFLFATQLAFALDFEGGLLKTAEVRKSESMFISFTPSSLTNIAEHNVLAGTAALNFQFLSRVQAEIVWNARTDGGGYIGFNVPYVLLPEEESVFGLSFIPGVLIGAAPQMGQPFGNLTLFRSLQATLVFSKEFPVESDGGGKTSAVPYAGVQTFPSWGSDGRYLETSVNGVLGIRTKGITNRSSAWLELDLGLKNTMTGIRVGYSVSSL